MKSTGQLQAETSVLMVIDIQERLMPSIYKNEEVFANTNRLIRGMKLMQVPVIVTEQYPKGLGNTCSEIEVPSTAHSVKKICFSCMLSADVKSCSKN